MIVAVGVDSVAIARVAGLLQRAGERFRRRVFTPAEIAYCDHRANPAESYAARFCAKEAAMKCLGTGWGAGIGWRDVEVARAPGGSVHLLLHGAAAARAASLGIGRCHVTLTHTETHATAFVVAEA